MSEHELLTVGEVALYLRVAERTVREIIRRGELTATKIGKSYRVKRTDLEALTQKQSEVQK